MKTKTVKPKISIKEKYGLSNGYDLVYIDQRDHIEDEKILEKMVQDGDKSALELDNIMDAQSDSVHGIIKDLKSEYPEMSNSDEEEIRDYLYEHDTSTPEADLLRNTPDGYFYYSLGLTDNGMELEGGDPDNVRVNAIIERLGIDDEPMRKVVREITANAGYGGSWVILFEDNIEDMLDDGNVIEFGPKAELCLMDRGNGSGHSAAIGRRLTCEFNRKNLHYDEGAPGYSYTKDVCGMSRGFMDGATIKTLSGETGLRPIPLMRSIEEERKMDREELLGARWRDTKTCTPGDMKWDRHPSGKIEYINNFPCGNKCTACGTFWVD